MTRYILPILIAFTSLFTSCIDEIDYQPIGEGNAKVSATVRFTPLISALQDSTSRTAGDAIKTISNLQVFIYTPSDELYDIRCFGEGLKKDADSDVAAEALTVSETNENMPSDLSNADQSEAKTGEATITLKNLPFGRYKIFAVANFRDYNTGNFRNITKGEAATPSDLKSLKSKWDQSDISRNDQMFGCFATDNQSNYDDAPVITINKPEVALNAWIKRLASKVTIVYDGQRLKEGIDIYIQKVSIRDIPFDCILGFDEAKLTDKQKQDQVNGNSPTSAKEETGGLIATPEQGTLYYKTVYQSNKVGEVDEVVTYDEDPNIDDYTHWLNINKSTGVLGAVSTNSETHTYNRDEDGEIITHTEQMQALYFYENCQGNYPDNEYYNKKPNSDDVGKDQETPGKNGYKDNVPYGTFIEVEGYYVSKNPDNQSSGPITYRFMLGQNTTYNYNALRNRHYKLTMKFKGYGNQPEWHIVYDEDEPGLYPQPEYKVSYMYDIRHDMPIRLTGKPKKVTIQIIENNWAPYDPTRPDSVAPAKVGIGNDNFRWYKDLYMQQGFEDLAGINAWMTKRPNPDSTRYDYSIIPAGGYYYGLHDRDSYGIEYNPPLRDGLIDKTKDYNKITPIWVGFLALQVPSAYDDYNTILTTGIQDKQGTDNYSNDNTIAGMKDYYIGKGGADTGSGPNQSNTNVGVKLYECSYEWAPQSLPTDPNTPIQVASNHGGSTTGRNAAKLQYNGDGSYTLTAPLFTMPKSIGYITGFSGNNPYEAYQRRAKVLITAEYEAGQTLRKICPVIQQRRLVNPKGVWRTGNNRDPFTVTLKYIDDPATDTYKDVESDGEWSAWVATAMDEQTPNTSSFIKLPEAGSDGKVRGTGFVTFTINFDGTTDESRCGKVIVKYHGNTCEHAIFVRQGYNVPLAIVNGGRQWSSFSVFAFDGLDLADATTNLPAANLDLNAEMTVNPLALGTMFKRGNYGQGIRIQNNKTFKIMEPLTLPGGTKGEAPLDLIRLKNDGSYDKSRTASWPSILGIRDNNTTVRAWQWSNFHSSIITTTQNYNYDVPTYDDYTALASQDFGIGVVYANGAGGTISKIEDACGYFNDGNTDEMLTSTSGMRGIIVYNKANFNQIFFPLGYSGVGRRTVQIVQDDSDRGYLRYGATWYRLSTSAASANQYRPISYNLPANPGALYWIKQTRRIAGTDAQGQATYTNLSAWDINYFDLSFNAYDAACNYPNGDAIPIKPIVISLR